MTTKLEQAKSRIEKMDFTQAQQDFIFADWPEGEEHLDWLITATREEIISWADTANWGVTPNTYTVIEDNGGGLHLYVWQDDQVVYGHSGYEHNPGQLTNDLRELDFGSDVETWDGNEDDPQAEWDYWTPEMQRNGGYQIVARGKNGERSIYADRMGAAARKEFNISDF